MPSLSSLPELPSFAFLTLDIIILAAVLLVCMLLYFRNGSTILTCLILAFYPATYIHGHFPYLKFDSDMVSIGAYVVLLFVIAIMIRNIIHGRHAHGFVQKVIYGLILAVSATILLLVLNYNILPVDAFYNFTLPFEGIFTEKVPVGIWLIVPLVGVYFVHRRTY